MKQFGTRENCPGRARYVKLDAVVKGTLNLDLF